MATSPDNKYRCSECDAELGDGDSTCRDGMCDDCYFDEDEDDDWDDEEDDWDDD